MEWENLYKFIRDFNEHSYMRNQKEDYKFFKAWELEMAKAFLHDYPEGAIRVAKVILAAKDINDVKD